MVGKIYRNIFTYLLWRLWLVRSGFACYVFAIRLLLTVHVYSIKLQLNGICLLQFITGVTFQTSGYLYNVPVDYETQYTTE